MIAPPRGSSGRAGAQFAPGHPAYVLDMKAPRGAFLFWAPGRGGICKEGALWALFRSRTVPVVPRKG